MTDEEIRKARENYKNLEAKKRELESMKNRLNELKENPLIQEYVELGRMIRINRSIFLTDDYLVEKAFNDIAVNTSFHNDIYVYVGDISYDSLFTGFSFPGGYKSHTLYKNLETEELEEVRIAKKKDFESKHTVIYLNQDKRENEDNSFEKIRNEFLSGLLTEPQEEVVKKFVMKYNSKE